MPRHVNGLKAAALLGLPAVPVLLAGWLLAGRGGLAAALAVAAPFALAGYLWSGRVALRASHARPVAPARAPALYAAVRELSARAGVPAPRLYLSPAPQPNAFATGHGPRHAALCVTQGALSLLSPAELRAVVAHELSHVYSRDTLPASIAACIACLIMLPADLVRLVPVGESEDEEAVNLFSGALLLLLAPLAAAVVHLAARRGREYGVDAEAVHLTGDPAALCRALRKIQYGTRRLPLPVHGQQVGAAHLMIANPLGRRRGLPALFVTHPPTGRRIARLELIAAARPAAVDPRLTPTG